MSLTFDIKNSQDLFKVLLENYEKYKEDELSVRKALNCVTVGWHLTEWACWHEKKWEEKTNRQVLGDFRKTLYDNCPELKVMHDICTGYKHYKITSPKSNISDSDLHEGTFGKTFGPTFNKSRLVIVSIGGDKQDFSIVIEKVVDFWTDYFQKFPEK
ncbi:hypothetical protein DYD21_06000 [Rhodohalobacter sp. SW132]|uniref:hypothetical protein n=1 Tax=Rhodohalobacter sp. SW132 TaxID=2293433 RepID=UPI000E269AA9|nr:hypothetical protein [Rhodohalobacter sp. SW132]REL38160.1 hypothetical protein DYD21_06000 [Rhodohalobacter sp. SW132]